MGNSRMSNFPAGRIAGIMIVAVFAVVALDGRSSAQPRPLRATFEFYPLYETNVFHYHANPVGDETDSLQAEIRWTTITPLSSNVVSTGTRRKSMRALKSRPYFGNILLLYANANFHAKHKDIDRSEIGFQYRPTLKYSSFGLLKLRGDVSRKKKFVSDNAGEISLELRYANVLDLSVEHELSVRNLQLGQAITYHNQDYDEQYLNGARVKPSYDYEYTKMEFSAAYEVTPWLTAKVAFDTERRFYKERFARKRTFVRNFRDNAGSFRVDVQPVRWAHGELGIDYTHRRENYENFYGYDQRKYQARLDITPHRKHRTDIHMAVRNKSYPNYFTSRIGLLRRVHYDYVEVDIRQTWKMTDRVSWCAYFSNYNKVSNDILAGYRNTVVGLGGIITL